MNKAFIIVFTTIGLLALGGILFVGAWWHWVTVGMCAIMVLSSINDKRRTEK